MSQYYPPPPGVDRRANASRYPPPSAPPNYGGGGGGGGGDSYRPPPSFHPPPPPSSSYDSYARNDRGDRGDRYSRNDRNDRDDRYQPSRRHDNNPFPARNQGSYEFRGSDSSRPPQGDFNFRVDKPNGVVDSYSSYRPGESRSRNEPSHGPARRFNQDRPTRPYGGRGRGGGAFRRPWKPFVASDRAILHTTDNNKPTEDFAADTAVGVSYKSIDQLSDSDEAEMDTSDSDDEHGQPTSKRARTTTSHIADGDNAPKWSNPDPYTALPAGDGSDKKKKDVVQLIRKARMQPAGGARASLRVHDENFIRCGSPSEDEGREDEGREDEGQEDEEEFIDPLTYRRDDASSQGVISTPMAPQATGARQSVPVTTAQISQVAASRAQPTSNTEKRLPAADFNMVTDLGTRKRTYDDVLKLPSHARLKPPPGRPAGGSLVEEWRPKKHEDPCPWIRAQTSEARTNVRCVKYHSITYYARH